MDSAWLEPFTGAETLEPRTRARLAAAARPGSLPAGARVFEPGSPCAGFFFVTAGSVLVQQLGEEGREIVLYRVRRGDTCVLTTACLFAHEAYAAEGIAESPVEARIIPAPVFQELVAASPAFRDLVFHSFGTRVTQLMQVIEEVVFRRIEVRLAARLLDRADAQGRVNLTHQDLAVELGSAREVISRQLKAFENRGWLRLSRGRVEILDRRALSGLL